MRASRNKMNSMVKKWQSRGLSKAAEAVNKFV